MEGALIVALVNSKLTMMAMGIKAALSIQLDMTTVLGKDEEISIPLFRS